MIPSDDRRPRTGVRMAAPARGRGASGPAGARVSLGVRIRDGHQSSRRNHFIETSVTRAAFRSIRARGASTARRRACAAIKAAARPDDGFGPAILDAEDAIDTPPAHRGCFGAVAGVRRGGRPRLAPADPSGRIERHSSCAPACTAIGKFAPRPTSSTRTSSVFLPRTAGHAPAIHVVELLIEPRADRFHASREYAEGGLFARRPSCRHSAAARHEGLPARDSTANVSRRVRRTPHDGLARRHNRRGARTPARQREQPQPASPQRRGRERASDNRLVCRRHGHTDETTIISIVSGLCGHSKASPFWI